MIVHDSVSMHYNLTKRGIIGSQKYECHPAQHKICQSTRMQIPQKCYEYTCNIAERTNQNTQRLIPI